MSFCSTPIHEHSIMHKPFYRCSAVAEREMPMARSLNKHCNKSVAAGVDARVLGRNRVGLPPATNMATSAANANVQPRQLRAATTLVRTRRIGRRMTYSRDAECPPTEKNEPPPVAINPVVPAEVAAPPAPTAGRKPWPAVARLAVRARDMMLRVMITLDLLPPARLVAIVRSRRPWFQGRITASSKVASVREIVLVCVQKHGQGSGSKYLTHGN